MRPRQVFSSLLLTVALTGGAVLADTLYVGVERGEVLSEPDSIFGDVLRRVDRGQALDGDPDAWQRGRQRNTFLQITLPDGTRGYIQASALVDQQPGQGDAQRRASSGAEGAGAAARGLTAEIESDLSAEDPAFAAHIQEVDRNEESVNRSLRASPTGRYDDGESAAMREAIRGFMQEGGLRHDR